MNQFDNDIIPCLAFSSLNLRSSSDLDADHGVKNAILNFKYDRKSNNKVGGEGWTSATTDKNQFIMATSIIPRHFIGMDIQGSGNEDSWVTNFIIRYSLDNKKWYDYKNGEQFKGNSDRDSIQRLSFTPIIYARSISIHPTSWNNSISMRFELYTKDYQFDSLPQIQMGTAMLDKTLGNKNGPMEFTRRIEFEREFQGVPKVSIGIKLLDSIGNKSISVTSANITTKGFDCQFKRYADSLINECHVDYTAVFTLGDSCNFNPTDKEFKNDQIYFYKKQQNTPYQPIQ